MFGVKFRKISNFHTLEVVGRGSETQLQVGEKIKYFTLAHWWLILAKIDSTCIIEQTALFVMYFFIDNFIKTMYIGRLIM